MSYVQHVLQPGETVRFATDVHWIKYWRGAGLLVVALLIYLFVDRSGMAPTTGAVIALAVAALGVGFLAVVWFTRWTTEIAITDRRIIKKTGFLSRDTMEMSLGKVESVKVDQSILGRMLGYGDITLQGTGGGSERLSTIADAIEFRSHVTAE